MQMFKWLLIGAAVLPLAAAEKALESEFKADAPAVLTLTAAPLVRTWGQKFAIKPGEQLAVEFTAAALGEARQFGKIMAGFRQFDARGRRLYSAHTDFVPDSDTVLTAPLAKGDKTLTVKNAAWRSAPQALVVVFNTRPDYADLPNFTINTGKNRAVKFTPGADGTVTVELAQPAATAFPAGTPVRLHRWSRESEYLFSCWPQPARKKYLFTVVPDKWQPGAKSAQLIFTFSCRAAFNGLKLQLERPEVKSRAVDGELF